METLTLLKETKVAVVPFSANLKSATLLLNVRGLMVIFPMEAFRPVEASIFSIAIFRKMEGSAKAAKSRLATNRTTAAIKILRRMDMVRPLMEKDY